MKKILTIFAVLIASTIYSQEVKTWHECSDQPLKYVVGLEGGVRNSYLSASIKIGFWQNNTPSGFTLFGGYTTLMEENPYKVKDFRSVDYYFVEVGYKFHLTEKVYLNGIVGSGRNNYLGIQTFYQCTNTIMVYGYFKDRTVGIGIHASIN